MAIFNYTHGRHFCFVLVGCVLVCFIEFHGMRFVEYIVVVERKVVKMSPKPRKCMHMRP